MQRDSVVHVELVDSRDERRWAEYQFLLGGPTTNYALYISRLAGDLPDAMANHTGMSFSTKDRDNLNSSSCARNFTGKKGEWAMFDAVHCAVSQQYLRLHLQCTPQSWLVGLTTQAGESRDVDPEVRFDEMKMSHE